MPPHPQLHHPHSRNDPLQLEFIAILFDSRTGKGLKPLVDEEIRSPIDLGSL
jgi:hypothetical protein